MPEHINHVVIVGAGQAGMVAAFELRRLGFDGDITLYGDEPDLPYERPELSKGYLAGTRDFAKLRMADQAALAAAKIAVRTSAPVAGLEPANKIITLQTGDRVAYDRLILATGGYARPLPGCLTLRTRSDADLLATQIAPGRSVAIFGAGWLGLELAAFAVQKGAFAHVFDPAAWLCARVLPQDVAQVLMDMHSASGVRFSLKTQPDIASIQKSHDLSLACIGMIPNVTIAARGGVDVDDGILVDETQQTSESGIYAIGDCARATGMARKESWDDANQSAKRAAAAICGQAPPARSPSWFWSVQGPAKIQMIGAFGENQDVMRSAPTAGGAFFRYNRADQTVGAIAINAPKEFAQARRALMPR